eukprot:5722319-Prymnesium_polylepis.1
MLHGRGDVGRRCCGSTPSLARAVALHVCAALARAIALGGLGRRGQWRLDRRPLVCAALIWRFARPALAR